MTTMCDTAAPTTPADAYPEAADTSLTVVIVAGTAHVHGPDDRQRAAAGRLARSFGAGVPVTVVRPAADSWGAMLGRLPAGMSVVDARSAA